MAFAALVDTGAIISLFGRDQPRTLHYRALFERAASEACRPRSEMDFADATLVWLAGDTGVLSVMTTDVRDFSRYRLPDGRAFEIL